MSNKKFGWNNSKIAQEAVERMHWNQFNITLNEILKGCIENEGGVPSG